MSGPLQREPHSPAAWTARAACAFLAVGALGGAAFFTVRPTLKALRATAMVATWGFSGASFLALVALAMAALARPRRGFALPLAVALVSAGWFVATGLGPGRELARDGDSPPAVGGMR